MDIHPSETILENDYPVFAGYIYLADGRPIHSDVTGKVGDLKRDLNEQGWEVMEIRRCDLAARGIL